MEGARPAVATDADACSGLCARALDEISGHRGGRLFVKREVGPLAEALTRPGGFEAVLADPGATVVVGLLDDVVVGLGSARAESVGETLLGVLDAFYVDPDARGVGVGRTMLDAIVSWLAEKGCTAIDVSVLPGQRETKNFFEAAGFKARLITMHMELS
jgi:GNAT superfamily N-acetyltransferase